MIINYPYQISRDRPNRLLVLFIRIKIASRRRVHRRNLCAWHRDSMDSLLLINTYLLRSSHSTAVSFQAI